MLCYYLDSEVSFIYVDVLVGFHGLYEALLYFGTGIVFMMQNTKFGVAPFAMQIKVAVFVFVEVYTPVNKSFYLLRRAFDHLFHSLSVAKEVARYHGVFDMLVKIVYFEIGHGSHATLREVSVGVFKVGLAYERHSACAGYFEGKAHAGYTRSYNEIIIFVSHSSMINYQAQR